MFNLNQAISEWRRKMSAGGIKTPAILDELESHLREDAEKLTKSGVLSEEETFMVAASRIGQSELLRAEFAKIGGLKEARLVKMIGIGCGMFAILFTLWAARWLLFVHELSALERAVGLGAVAVTLFSVVSWRFSYKYLPVIRSRRARMTAGIICGLVSMGSFYIFGLLLTNVIVPQLFHGNFFVPDVRLSGGKVLPGIRSAEPGEYSLIFWMGISILWAVAVTAIPGAIAYGLEEAARRRMKENAYV